MSVRVSPWKDTGKFMVVVRFRWPDRSVVRDRTVVDTKTEAAARRWGEQRERELLAKGQQKLEDEKASNEPPCLSVSAWYGKYHEAAERGEVGRKNRGKPQTAVRDRRDRFKNWIEPEIGHLPMNKVTTEHLRAIVAKLDEQVRLRMRFYEGAVEREERLGKMRKAGLSAKSAAHIWSEVTSGFREALSSKLDHLRVLRVDPTIGIQPPMSTDSREQEALYPSEVHQLLSCEEIPLPRRRCHAVAIYTALRRSELERLEAPHIDFEHGVITVQGTKTNAARRQVPIEPALLPLLKKLVENRPAGPLLDVPDAHGHHGAAAVTKMDLAKARLTRPELHRDDDRFMPYTFHAHRHTAITHWAVAGKSQLFLLTVAGHLDIAMTKKYLGKAAAVSSKFGKPHPELPSSLLGGAKVIRLGARSA